MDKMALSSLLVEANVQTPPKVEALVRLGKFISAEPEFFNVPGGTNRFEVDLAGKPRTGYGFSAQVERVPIDGLVFVIADLVREGLRPEYLRKLYQLWKAHPQWFGLRTASTLRRA
jgi:hypothetical protein